MSFIVHLTPSKLDHDNLLSDNLGDVIIYTYISKIIKEIFPHHEIIELSTHHFLSKKHIEIIRKAEYTIIGGSNLLSSDIYKYNQWKTYENRFYYLFPNIHNIILLGVGWWQYQTAPTLLTCRFYSQVFHPNLIHSVRDTYTANALSKTGIKNIVNTSCPTTWNLNGLNLSFKSGKNKKCIFAITDYNKNIELDNQLISILITLYDELYFFPQGKEDEDYLYTLEQYKSNKNKITTINRTIHDLDNIIKQTNIDYIGTRLHLGIHCLNHQINSLIISIDNRAMEIHKDIGLPCIERKQQQLIYDWYNNQLTFQPIQLPLQAINQWKNQF